MYLGLLSILDLTQWKHWDPSKCTQQLYVYMYRNTYLTYTLRSTRSPYSRRPQSLQVSLLSYYSSQWRAFAGPFILRTVSRNRPGLSIFIWGYRRENFVVRSSAAESTAPGCDASFSASSNS